MRPLTLDAEGLGHLAEQGRQLRFRDFRVVKVKT